MSKKYTVKIRSNYEEDKREVLITEATPMLAHKRALLKSVKQFEEIHTILNENGRVVYDIKNGFNYGE